MDNRLGEIRSKRLILIKGFLFLGLGLLSFGLLCVFSWDARTILCGAIAVWAFCRFYYFAFYVIEHYVDPEYKFASLFSFLLYMKNRRKDPSS